jgi:hypothetical protein
MTRTVVAAGKAACGWDEIDGLLPPWPCGEPAICTVTEACEHEHVNEARACATHAVGVQMDGPGLCYQCGTGPRQHDCATTTVITWDDPTAPAVVLREEETHAG